MLGEAMLNDVPGTLELQYVDNSSINLSLPSQIIKFLTNIKSSKQKKMPVYKNLITKKNDELKGLEQMKEKCLLMSPVQLFEVFFSNKVLDHIVKETVHYTIEQKNKGICTVSKDEIKAHFGILLFTGYHQLPSERHYWSNEEVLGIDIVKRALSQNRYLEIKSLLHFTDNSEAEKYKEDRGFKVRPLFNKINNSFHQFGVMEKNVAVDEIIVCY